VRDGEIETRLSNDVKATMLFAADVAEWQTIQIAEAVPSGELEDLVVEQAKAAGVDTSRPFPFLIEGELAGLEAHVIAGQCPMQATMSSQPLTSPPVRRSFARVRGRLVGIWTSDGGGVITHHGSRAHVHAIVEGDALFTGHCEAVAVEAGAVLRLPAP
jgi:acetolactate decarboxylase